MDRVQRNGGFFQHQIQGINEHPAWQSGPAGCSFSVKTHRKKAASNVCILQALLFCAFLFLTEFRI
jgi:hypothetical protein